MYAQVNSVKLTPRELAMLSVGVLIRFYFRQGPLTSAGFAMFSDVIATIMSIEEAGVLEPEPLQEVRNAD